MSTLQHTLVPGGDSQDASSVSLLPGLHNPSGLTGSPVVMATPQKKHSPHPLPQALQRIRQHIRGCCTSERWFGVFLPGVILISVVWVAMGQMLWLLTAGSLGSPHLPSPPLGTPAQDTAALLSTRLDSSIPLPASLPALLQPCPHTQLGAGLNLSRGFGCSRLQAGSSDSGREG